MRGPKGAGPKGKAQGRGAQRGGDPNPEKGCGPEGWQHNPTPHHTTPHHTTPTPHHTTPHHTTPHHTTPTPHPHHTTPQQQHTTQQQHKHNYTTPTPQHNTTTPTTQTPTPTPTPRWSQVDLGLSWPGPESGMLCQLIDGASAACPAQPASLEMISITSAAVICDAVEPRSVKTAWEPESSFTMSFRNTTPPLYF